MVLRERKVPLESAPGKIVSVSQPGRGQGQGMALCGSEAPPLPSGALQSADLCSQNPPCRSLFLLSRFLILPNMLQSSLSGQVACVGMLVCVAKPNRCRKICLKSGEGGRQSWGKWEGGCVAGRAGLKSIYLQNRGLTKV